ncbi:hypothetical protein G7070_11720 [Propioniciclava coleopterorum]|uniref:Uncharacterized protein n=1 Tax=Propioniciclava coleopterorum TaxID=2714937 RepID=A0A6G7Y840_9ACTN|nr:hypothetical protein [Propioniciclava coleopterorum]QIK72818.1 hypothetical protein G7070_11720 [Propioniciclava coleopterorum]
MSVRVAGRDATVAALQGLVRAEHADFVVGVERMPACEPARLRGPVAGAIADVVAARVLSDEELAEALAEQEASAFDTHPPLRERIARIRSLPDVEAPRDDRSALVLVGGAERLAEHEGDLRVAHEALATWDEVLAAGGAVAARQAGDRLVVELAENEVCHPASYRAALEAAARDIEEDGELWGSFSTLNHLVDGALARVPGARQVVRDARVVWAAPDGGVIAPPEPADEASGAERVAGLIGWLASCGAPLDEPVTASRQDWELPELIEWRSHQRTAAGDTVHVAAWTSGVLLLPADYSAGTRAAANVGVTPDRSLLERAVGAGPFDARLLPGAIWIPAEQVASVKEAILRGRLTLTLADGTTHELTAQPGSGEKIIAHGGLVELPGWVAANDLAATS